MDMLYKVMLVEDEVVTAMLMQRQLKRFGIHVAEHVTTGEEAVVKSQSMQFDCILMDIQLAGPMDGIEATRQIQQTSKTPIVFITGFENPSIQERAEMLKPLGYLIKPVKEVQLLELIKSVIV